MGNGKKSAGYLLTLAAGGRAQFIGGRFAAYRRNKSIRCQAGGDAGGKFQIQKSLYHYDSASIDCHDPFGRRAPYTRQNARLRKGRGNNILSPDGARRIDRNRGGQLLSGDAESFVDPLSGKRRFRSKICRTVIMRHVFLIVYTGGRICSDTRTDFRGTADCVTHLRPGSADPVRSMLYSEQKK